MEVTIKPLKEEKDMLWETVYVAVPMYGKQDMKPITIIETDLIKAVDKAKVYVKENPNSPLVINIGKRLVSGDIVCAIIE
tara:strand:- start:51 stop:290 length:240 start_codon:yes stop_codon:yes gene_type:complete